MCQAFLPGVLWSRADKDRFGYAKFDPADPSVTLSLSEVVGSTSATGPQDTIMHYGVEVKPIGIVQSVVARLLCAGIPVHKEKGSICFTRHSYVSTQACRP